MKSVDYLVEYAKAQVGRPYWMGTYGQIADVVLLAYKRNQYPQGYPTPGNPKFMDQLGQKVHDCNGLVYAASECETPDSKPRKYPDPYYGVPTLFKHCSEAGVLDANTQLVKGELLFRNNLGHVGIYGGDGFVYHAKGHAWGVLKEKYDYKQWTHHGKFTEMYDYSSGKRKLEINMPTTIKEGMLGPTVKDWQALLLSAGFELPIYGMDGDFGKETKKATIEYQQSRNIYADGIVDHSTWQERLNEI